MKQLLMALALGVSMASNLPPQSPLPGNGFFASRDK